jgi:hypothetical protein
MIINNPPVISKFGITSMFNVEDRFKDHELLKEYNLRVVFSHWFTKEEANELENKYLQTYPKINYDFDLDNFVNLDGRSEMRYIDEGIVNKIRSELYDLKQNSDSFQVLKEKKQHIMKFYFVQFIKK